VRVIDFDAIKKELGGFVIGRKTYKVFEPTIKQLVQHEDMFRKAKQEAMKAEEDGDGDKASKRWRDYLIDEVCLFVPTLTREEAMNLTMDQRVMVMGLIRGETPDETLPEPKKKSPMIKGKRKR
jgi:hypothetical protein